MLNNYQWRIQDFPEGVSQSIIWKKNFQKLRRPPVTRNWLLHSNTVFSLDNCTHQTVCHVLLAYSLEAVSPLLRINSRFWSNGTKQDIYQSTLSSHSLSCKNIDFGCSAAVCSKIVEQDGGTWKMKISYSMNVHWMKPLLRYALYNLLVIVNPWHIFVFYKILDQNWTSWNIANNIVVKLFS